MKVRENPDKEKNCSSLLLQRQWLMYRLCCF
jgi:hypothetical protein